MSGRAGGGRLRALLGSRFLRESTTLQLASVAIAGSSLVSSVLLAHILREREQAVFYLAISAYAMFWTFLNLGIAPVATMRIARAARSDDPALMAGVMGVFLRLSMALAAVALVIGVGLWLLAPDEWLASTFKGNGTRVALYAAILTAAPLFEAPRNLFAASLQGERRMVELARVEVGAELARLGFVVSGALITGDALGPTLGTLCGLFAGSLLGLDAYRRASREPGSHLPPLRVALRSKGGTSNRWVLREGVKVGLVRNVDSLGTQTIPTLLLGMFGETAWVTYLRIAQRFGALMRTVMAGINRTALPALSSLAAVKDLAGLRRVYWKASLLSGATVSLGMLVLLPFLPPILGRLYPATYGGPIFTMVLILVPGLAVASFSVANDVFYLVTQQLRTAMWISLLGLAFGTLAIGVGLRYLPGYGAAVGMSIASLWSLVHMGYAGRWLAQHGRAGAGRAEPESLSGSSPAPAD